MKALLGLLIATVASAGTFHRAVRTADGQTLALYRYAAPGATRPVLLVPDLAMNREVFDLGGRGLAAFLAAHGREVYVLEPRGQGASSARGPVHLADVVKQDLPAAIAAIGQPVDLVAYGFSGTLALAATTNELAGKVHRVVALSTPALPDVPNPIVATVLEHGGGFGSLSEDPTGGQAFEMIFCHHGIFWPGDLERLRSSVGDLDHTEAGEWLGWLRSGDLALGDGTTVKQRLAKYDRPTLLFLPFGDNLAHPEFASPLRELATHAPIREHSLSKLELLAEDYSHLSLVQGRDARNDVFKPALEFLDEQPTVVAK